MPTAFETYDDNGRIQLSSQDKSIATNTPLSGFADSNPLFALSTTIMESGVTGRRCSLFGVRGANNSLMVLDATKSYWVRIPDGGAITRIGNRLGANTGNYTIIEGTNSLLNHVPGGGLEIFDDAGALMWSAASANRVPRIDGIFSASRNALWDNVGGAAMASSSQPFFMINSLPGWVQIPEEGINEVHAVSIVRQGNTYYMFADIKSSFVTRATAKEAFSPYGLQVPYATIFGV